MLRRTIVRHWTSKVWRSKSGRLDSSGGARDLARRFNLSGPYNYHSVSSQFLANAFSADEYKPYPRKMLSSALSEGEVRQLLENFIDGQIGQEGLSRAIFGCSYAEIVEHTHEQERINRSAASPAMLERLARSTISADWIAALDEGEPHPTVMRCLGDAGCRPATSSGLVHDGWNFGDSHAPVYADAARIGFVAVAAHYSLVQSHFRWKDDQRSLDRIAGAAVIARPVVPHPLTILPVDQQDQVRLRCRQLAHQLERMFGKPDGQERLPYTFEAEPFAESLWRASEHGSMIAAIGIDPSSCIIYGSDGQPLHPRDLPWIR